MSGSPHDDARTAGGEGIPDALASWFAELRRREPEATTRFLDLAQEMVGVARALLDAAERVLDDQRAAVAAERSATRRVHRIDVDSEPASGEGGP